MTTLASAPPATDVEAAGVPMNVIAVKWPGHWIIRGMRCFSNLEFVYQMVWPFVAAAPQDELEWTHHRYQFPSYIVYGSGELLGLSGTRGGERNWPAPPEGCVYLFPHSGREGSDIYRGEARRLDQ